MDYNRLLVYKNNINKLIFYKGFCPCTQERASAAIFAMGNRNEVDYRVIINIQYKYNNDWRPNCFDISKYDTFGETKTSLFSLNNCFKIKDVIINQELKKGEILLESVGIKKNENIQEIKDIIYNENGNFLNFV